MNKTNITLHIISTSTNNHPVTHLCTIEKSLDAIISATSNDLSLTMLLHAHPYQLTPEEFSAYLSLRKKGVSFAHFAHYLPTDPNCTHIIMSDTTEINTDVLQYIQYFFEDSDCPLAFVPVLSQGEPMPTDLVNLPPGSISENMALLTQYNFVCAMSGTQLFDIYKNCALKLNRLPRKPRSAHENVSESGSIFVRLNGFPKKSTEACENALQSDDARIQNADYNHAAKTQIATALAQHTKRFGILAAVSCKDTAGIYRNLPLNNHNASKIPTPIANIPPQPNIVKSMRTGPDGVTPENAKRAFSGAFVTRGRTDFELFHYNIGVFITNVSNFFDNVEIEGHFVTLANSNAKLTVVGLLPTGESNVISFSVWEMNGITHDQPIIAESMGGCTNVVASANATQASSDAVARRGKSDLGLLNYKQYGFSCKLALHCSIQEHMPIEGSRSTSLKFMHGKKIITKVHFQQQRNYTLHLTKNALHITKIAMRPHYKISCIIPVHTYHQHISTAVNSVLAQSLNFEQDIQLVLVNDGGDGAVHALLNSIWQQHMHNIVYIRLPHAGVSAARNAGLACAMGKYITFLDADDTLDPHMFEHGIRYLENKKNVDFAVFPINMFGTEDVQDAEIDARFNQNATIINLDAEPQKVQFSACGVVMRASAINDLAFDTALNFSEDVEFMCRALANKRAYLVCNEASYNYRIIPGKYMHNTGQFGGTGDFSHSLARFFSNRGEVMPAFVQHAILHDIARAAFCPPAIPTVDVSHSINKISAALNYVDNDIILNTSRLYPAQQEYLLGLKHNSGITIANGDYFAGNYNMGCATVNLYVDYVHEEDGCLQIHGYFYMPTYDSVSLHAQSTYNNKVLHNNTFEATLSPDNRVAVSFFGDVRHTARSFCVSIPTAPLGHDKPIMQEISLNLMYNNIVVDSTIIFPNKFLYASNNIIATSDINCHTILVHPFTLKVMQGLLAKNTYAPDIIAEYVALHPFLSRSKIWLFVDLSHIIADNAATHLFNNCTTSGVDRYMVLSSANVPFNSNEPIIEIASATFKIMAMFAEKIFVSSVSDIEAVKSNLPPTAATFVYVPSEIIHKNDKGLNILSTIPLELVALTSPDEVQFLPGQKIQNIAHITGNPKYDALASTGEKRILFMPSYRKHLYHGKTYNADFIHSKYATTIGDLLLNERFLDFADSQGISVDFAPHPKTELQMIDFDMDDSIKIIPSSIPRAGLCQNAALLITDTLPACGFAHLGKPVIYYQFDSDGTQPAFDARLGDIATSFDHLVDLLIYYMSNGCKPKAEHTNYLAKIFPHRDGNSCTRIFRLL